MHSAKRVPLPHSLRVQCARLLPRLRLIPEFEAWLGVDESQTCLKYLPWTTYSAHGDVHLLYDCLSRGEPLCTLLELLGFKGAGLVEPDSVPATSVDEHTKRSVAEFVQGVRTLELSGKIPYGETFRINDLMEGTYAGFSKVWHSLCMRLLEAIQDSSRSCAP